MRNFRRALICIFLVVFQAANTSCIHLKPREIQLVDLNQDPDLAKLANPDLEIQYLVYRPYQLPLNDFFRNLKRGNYKNAFQRIHFTYRPSNFNNQAVEELIGAGFIPVYIKVENSSSRPLTFDEKSFTLTDGAKVLNAVPSKDLPRELKRFSPEAVVANVYNTGVVVLIFVAVMAVIVVAAKEGRGGAFGNLSFDSGNSSGPDPRFTSPDETFNDVHQVTKVDYRHYLITSRVLKPGEFVQGLVFFMDSQESPDPNYHLEFKANKF